MSNNVIIEQIELPSKGALYSKQFPTTFKVRAFGIEEEEIRANKTKQPFSVLCQAIDNCIIDKIGISSYDMHIIDYQAVLIKQRCITYGSEYKYQVICTKCGKPTDGELNLDEVDFYDLEKLAELLEFETKNHKIKLKNITPRVMDLIRKHIDAQVAKRKVDEDAATLTAWPIACIETLNGKRYNEGDLEDVIRSMSLVDLKQIQSRIAKVLNLLGVSGGGVCRKCGEDFPVQVYFGSEFFGPSFE